jgi:hypothetical protein
MSTSVLFFKRVAMLLQKLPPHTVIPAQAGIQLWAGLVVVKLDSRLRGNDGFRGSIVGASL